MRSLRQFTHVRVGVRAHTSMHLRALAHTRTRTHPHARVCSRVRRPITISQIKLGVSSKLGADFFLIFLLRFTDHRN